METATSEYIGKSALIIDDNAFSRRLLRVMLEQMGFSRVLESEDGQSGLQQCRSAKPDLIIVDWIMPDMSGEETVRKLISANIAGKTAPILVSSTIANRDAIVRAARLGTAGFIVKPFATPTLRARIDRIFTPRTSASPHSPARAVNAR